MKISDNYTVKANDYIVLVDSVKKITVSLPDVKENKTFIIKDIKNASKNNITIKCVNQNSKIDDAKSLIINSDFESLTLFTDGVDYYIL